MSGDRAAVGAPGKSTGNGAPAGAWNQAGPALVGASAAEAPHAGNGGGHEPAHAGGNGNGHGHGNGNGGPQAAGLVTGAEGPGKGYTLAPGVVAHTVSEVEVALPSGVGSARLRTDTAVSRAELARLKGYTGDACGECGSFTMVRNGSCLKCDSCGQTSGCS